MPLTPIGEPEHTGAERYEIWFAFGDDERETMRKNAPPYAIVAEEVCLVWTRQRGGAWVRDATRQSGSRVVGHERPFDTSAKDRGRTMWRLLYLSNTGREFRPFVLEMPGLVELIEKTEASLPQ